MVVGFIGTGSMGSILIEALLQSRALVPQQLIASNRTMEKVIRLAEQYPGITVAQSNSEVAIHSDLIFICVKPLEFKPVIDDIREVVQPEQIVVSITSPVLISLLEDHLPCKIAKVIPSITNYECSGATLCMYGKRINDEDRETIEQLLGQISTPIRIEEKYTRVCSDLSSCGPAFLCYFLQQFIDAAVHERGIPAEEATRLASQMLHGTGKLITKGDFTPQKLQERVTVPGGITAEGLRLMEHQLQGMFQQLIRTTHEKYEKELEKIESAFYGMKVVD